MLVYLEMVQSDFYFFLIFAKKSQYRFEFNTLSLTAFPPSDLDGYYPCVPSHQVYLSRQLPLHLSLNFAPNFCRNSMVQLCVSQHLHFGVVSDARLGARYGRYGAAWATLALAVTKFILVSNQNFVRILNIFFSQLTDIHFHPCRAVARARK